jgi:hypothetical protein
MASDAVPIDRYANCKAFSDTSGAGCILETNLLAWPVLEFTQAGMWQYNPTVMWELTNLSLQLAQCVWWVAELQPAVRIHE